MKKLDVLFVGDKWLANEPRFGPSMHQNIIIGSLESTDYATARTFYYDEAAAQGKPVDDGLLACCSTPPDVVVCHYSIGYPYLPRLDTFAKLRASGVPIVFIWYDMVYWPNARIVDETIVPVCTVNVVFDVDAYPTSFPEKYLNLWAPFDARQFHDPGLERTIAVSYVGSQEAFPRRTQALTALRAQGIEVMASGGMGEKDSHRLPDQEFIRILQSSRMSLNFSWASSGEPPAWYPVVPHQVKGRVFEIMSCGALLLESDNSQIQRWFIPFQDYVPWSSESDLADKIRYYQLHQEECRAIARSGHKKTMEDFSAKRFWSRVLKHVGLTEKGSV